MTVHRRQQAHLHVSAVPAEAEDRQLAGRFVTHRVDADMAPAAGDLVNPCGDVGTVGDKLRILSGRPPVPVGRALAALRSFDWK